MDRTAEDTALWRRLLAYCWYAWGLSWCHWGIRTAEQTFFRAGVRSFDRAIAIWPQFAGGFYRRGLIRARELSEHSAGIADLTSAIQLLPAWPDPYLQRGLFQRFHGDLQEAVGDLQRYIELTDDPLWQAEARQQLASIQAELTDRAAEPTRHE